MDKKNHIQKGNYYIHFKGYLDSNQGTLDNPNLHYLYRVLETNALHSENTEPYVVYRNVLSGQTWIRPREDFISEVDRVKYPNVPESITFRFTYIDEVNLKHLCQAQNYTLTEIYLKHLRQALDYTLSEN